MTCEVCGDEDSVRHRALIRLPNVNDNPPVWAYVCEECFRAYSDLKLVLACREVAPNLVPPRIPRR